MRSVAFLTSIGGVGFGGVAAPAPSLDASALELRYDRDRPDGQRLIVTIGGEPKSARIPDWQLVPIARFADSDQASLITAFGGLHDAASTEEVQRRGGKVINYHPAIQNTLLGLRLMQADVLLFMPDTFDLPKLNGEYLLGAGEAPPALESAMEAHGAFSRNMLEARRRGDAHRSYVLADEGAAVTFDVADDVLTLTGTPRYHFWRFAEDAPAYDGEIASRSALESLQVDVEAAELESDRKEQSWYIARIEDTLIERSACLHAAVPTRLLGPERVRQHLQKATLPMLVAVLATGAKESCASSVAPLEALVSKNREAWKLSSRKTSRIGVELIAAHLDAEGFTAAQARAWLLARIDEELREEASCVPVHLGLADKEDDKARLRTVLKQVDNTNLLSLLKTLTVMGAGCEIDSMPGYAEALFDEGMPESLNPAVLDAAQTTMQYSAFFRYVKQEHPVAWRKFMARTRSIKVAPAVETPSHLEAQDDPSGTPEIDIIQ